MRLGIIATLTTIQSASAIGTKGLKSARAAVRLPRTDTSFDPPERSWTRFNQLILVGLKRR